jgi:hypothetical protein
MGNDFKSIEHLEELGETLFCVYFYIPYELSKAIAYMKWKGFRTDLMYSLSTPGNDTIIVFYQDEQFVPDLDDVDQFYKVVDEENIWEKSDGSLNDYRYRVLSEGVICISFISIENAAIDARTRKFKEE